MTEPPLAIGARLARYDGIRTLGARADLAAYSPEELAAIRRAPLILYPTAALAAPLAAMGKRLYPPLACHLLEGDKIQQSRLFTLLGLATPRTRVYFGRQRAAIAADFAFPFIAKTPRGSSMGRGVFLVRDQEGLAAYLEGHDPAYVQERLPIRGDVRVVVIAGRAVCAYWRWAAEGEHRSNLAQGGRVDFEAVPEAAVGLALELCRRGGLDDVGVDVAVVEGRPYLLEFTMKYGLEGPRRAGLDLPAHIAAKALAGEL